MNNVKHMERPDNKFGFSVISEMFSMRPARPYWCRMWFKADIPYMYTSYMKYGEQRTNGERGIHFAVKISNGIQYMSDIF